MYIHILGICGTFMGGIALLAKHAGHTVSGSDANVYPPMSTQLEDQGITLMEGYSADHLKHEPDMVVVGNALSRGNPAVEYVLARGFRYVSGPQWLAEHFLQDRWVLAVAGTHGKTTTASLLAWILEYAELKPGFLIGGVPKNFEISARAGEAPFFVIEADEYDTAFFDKRSKFVHYHPHTLIINNLEFDHADIFNDIRDIQRQFHHLIKTVPGNGMIIYNQDTTALSEVMDMGCWTPTERFSSMSRAGWNLRHHKDNDFAFDVILDGERIGGTELVLPGSHNQLNAVAAIAAARHAGVPVDVSLQAIKAFQGVKRRMELRGKVNGIRVYDDFAHHPTAIQLTLQGLRQQVGEQRILAVLEPRSNTMRMGIHRERLASSLDMADKVYLYQSPQAKWSTEKIVMQIGESATSHNDIDSMVKKIKSEAVEGDHILIMSNGGFDNVHEKLMEAMA